MNALYTYLPQDRRLALSRQEVLPDRAGGTTLFADISGFTPLTEQLTQSLGPRRGAEELSNHLNRVYAALIGTLEKYGGSVIDFAGDAITCWFDAQGGSSVLRGLAAAQEMQAVMLAFPELALKIALATGTVRRFVVGDPQIQQIDTLAGALLTRMAGGEHLAQKGEILIDEATLREAGEQIRVGELRQVEDGDKYWVVQALSAKVPPQPFPPNLGDFEARSWLLPAIYEREQSGHGAFLTELRPAVALFLSFTGIDYDNDLNAGEKLSAIIRQVQAILTRSEGMLLQLNMGDKGSYLYAAFGAPVAHENDVQRALNAALELRTLPAQLPFVATIQMGISRGILRTGVYGGATRHTYGVLGDEVNLASRLMQSAGPGRVLVSAQVQAPAEKDFDFEALPALQLKGKSEAVSAFALIGPQQRKNYRLLDPSYALPMVGRKLELALLTEKMQIAAQGRGQIVAITAEAGMGKSRLVAEAIHLAQRRGFTGYGGACQSDGIHTGYLVWRSILRGLFDVDAGAPLEKQAKWLTSALQSFAPQHLAALPLVAAAIGLTLPDNDFTRGLEPKDRKATLEAALVDCVRGVARAVGASGSALLFVFEDIHWIDALSADLLAEVAQEIAVLPVLILLAYRPPEKEHLAAPRFEQSAYFSKIELRELSLDEANQAVFAKLTQLFPDHSGELPAIVTQQLMNRAQGNPFYLEELINYLHDQNIDPRQAGGLEQIELPDSLHTLVLSRIDPLNEHAKTTLKVASIIGRLFSLVWLHGYYPALGSLERVKAALAALAQLDLTPLDTPEPDLTYLFKHIVTREVAYESLSYAMRAQLHERLAQYIETQGAEGYLDLLAFHYSLSDNPAKQREYLQKAGEAAQAAYDNETALDYFARLLPLLDDPHAQLELHLKRGAVLELMGRWPDAEAAYQTALDISIQAGLGQALTARCQRVLGTLRSLRGDYGAALTWLEQSRAIFSALDERSGLALTLIEIGIVRWRQGEYTSARQELEASLELARALGDKTTITLALNNLGNVAWNQGDYPKSRALHEESLALRRERGDQRGIASSLNNLGLVASDQGDYLEARVLYEESLALKRMMNDKRGIANSLNNLGAVALKLGDFAAARTLFEEGLELRREIGDKRGITVSLNSLGLTATEQGDY